MAPFRTTRCAVRQYINHPAPSGSDTTHYRVEAQRHMIRSSNIHSPFQLCRNARKFFGLSPAVSAKGGPTARRCTVAPSFITDTGTPLTSPGSPIVLVRPYRCAWRVAGPSSGHG
eukprot:scaffold11140_cov51-Cyclotella_meneghiniana.AAC.4